MLESKITSGRWILKEDEFFVLDENGECIADCMNISLPSMVSKANARLIAKAPDMLKELKHCLGILCTPNEKDQIRLTCKEQCDTIVRIKNILEGKN